MGQINRRRWNLTADLWGLHRQACRLMCHPERGAGAGLRGGAPGRGRQLTGSWERVNVWQTDVCWATQTPRDAERNFRALPRSSLVAAPVPVTLESPGGQCPYWSRSSSHILSGSQGDGQRSFLNLLFLKIIHTYILDNSPLQKPCWSWKKKSQDEDDVKDGQDVTRNLLKMRISANETFQILIGVFVGLFFFLTWLGTHFKMWLKSLKCQG